MLRALTESETDIISDSNIIPYSQYLSETQQETVQNSNSYAQQDVLILLPRHIFNNLNQTSTAKEIWDNVEMLMQGSGRTIQQRKEDLLVNDMKDYSAQQTNSSDEQKPRVCHNQPLIGEQSTSIVDPLAYVAHTTTAPVLPSPSTSSPQPTAQSPNDALMATMTQIANLLSGFQKQVFQSTTNTSSRLPSNKEDSCYDSENSPGRTFNSESETEIDDNTIPYQHQYLFDTECPKHPTENANKVARDMLQRFNMPTQTIPMLSKKPKRATKDLHKDILGTRNPGLGYMAKRAQPVLYDADTLLHPNHHPTPLGDQAYWLSANEIASQASKSATPVRTAFGDELRSACDREHTKVLELEAEISKQKQLISESEKRTTEGIVTKQVLETDRIQLKDTITSLRIQLDGLKVEYVSLKRRYDELLKRIHTHSGPSTSETLNACSWNVTT
ncbi:hypothetical protein Tco_0226814 [Tanacetum coccineum]